MLPAGEGGWLLACVGLWGPLGVEQGPQEVAQTACPTHWPPEELPSPTTSGFVRDLRESTQLILQSLLTGVTQHHPAGRGRGHLWGA